MVGLDFETIKDKSPFELSGGQMRRVAIAGVLAMEPAVLILDEPTAGLDPRGREEILAQIKLLHTQKQITVILVSHSMEDIGKMVDKILVINEGEVVFFDTPSHVFTQISTLESIGLAVPEVTYLMRRLKEKYPEIREDIFTVEAAKKEILKVIRG
jgi:energy-coupling factor transport system ATP-binding protein